MTKCIMYDNMTACTSTFWHHFQAVVSIHDSFLWSSIEATKMQSNQSTDLTESAVQS